MTVLLHKTQCQRHSKLIRRSLENKLAVFINKETSSLKHNKYWCVLKDKSIRHLLKAVYLNGIFHVDSMKQLLNNRETVSNSDTEGDSDSWPSDDENEDHNEHRNAINVLLRDANNNIIRGSNAPKLTFGERINFKININQLNSMFPLSLKNLARLKIKSTVQKYTVKSVDSLSILPEDLKRFVLFQDEIDNAIKSLL